MLKLIKILIFGNFFKIYGTDSNGKLSSGVLSKLIQQCDKADYSTNELKKIHVINSKDILNK